MIVCCEKILENAHIQFPNFEFFNSNAWLGLECLNLMFQSSCYYFKIKVSTRDLRSDFSLKTKEDNKEAQVLKVHSTPDLVKSSEHVTLAAVESVNKQLKAVSK